MYGPPRISIEVEINSDGHHLIAIRDNGIGFDEIYKEKIFKPFKLSCPKEVHNGQLSIGPRQTP